MTEKQLELVIYKKVIEEANKRINEREKLRDNASKMGWFKLASIHQEVIDEIVSLKLKLLGDSANE